MKNLKHLFQAFLRSRHALGLFRRNALPSGTAMHRSVSPALTRELLRASRDDTATNQWLHAPPMTEKTRVIVRPSPDLAYSSCVYDLSKGPVRIVVKPWSDYMSLSLFDAATDNYYTLNDRQMPREGAEVILHSKGQAVPAGLKPFATVESPSVRGVALIRRLAPTDERFAAADAARGEEKCEPLNAGQQIMPKNGPSTGGQ